MPQARSKKFPTSSLPAQEWQHITEPLRQTPARPNILTAQKLLSQIPLARQRTFESRSVPQFCLPPNACPNFVFNSNLPPRNSSTFQFRFSCPPKYLPANDLSSSVSYFCPPPNDCPPHSIFNQIKSDSIYRRYIMKQNICFAAFTPTTLMLCENRCKIHDKCSRLRTTIKIPIHFHYKTSSKLINLKHCKP